MTNQKLPEYLTLKQVSDLLKVHPNTLRNWDKSGTLKPIRVGECKLRRYEAQVILDFLSKAAEEN